MRVAVDAMGGDRAPEEVVRGALRAASSEPDLDVVLVGDRAVIEQEVSRCNGRMDRVAIHHCTQVIGMHESPVEALRRKPDASIRVCWELASAKEAGALVSAGNTGAAVGWGVIGAGRSNVLRGVRRPGIAVAFPTRGEPCVLMDGGANIKAKPVHLYQYAVMANAYSRYILGVDSPRVGLLSVGEEEGKGNALVKETRDLLQRSQLNFVGNVEGRELHSGNCDVIICDGFVGNVILKSCEGLGEFVMDTFDEAVRRHLGPDDALHEALEDFWAKLDYAEYGGAPLLGIREICIICHGRSNAQAICNAILLAHRFDKNQLNDHIVGELNAPAPTEA